VSSSASTNDSPIVVWVHTLLMLMSSVVIGSGGRILCLSLYILPLHDCKVGMCSTSCLVSSFHSVLRNFTSSSLHIAGTKCHFIPAAGFHLLKYVIYFQDHVISWMVVVVCYFSWQIVVGVYSCWTVDGGTFPVYSIFPSVLSLELKTIVYRVLST
jgi:hypothetical protein